MQVCLSMHVIGNIGSHAPQWGTADAEVRVPSAQKLVLPKVISLKMFFLHRN